MLMGVALLPPSFPPSGTFYFINRLPRANISVPNVSMYSDLSCIAERG